MDDEHAMGRSDVEPLGYKPPTSAQELLERYAAGERYFARADLSDSSLSHMCLDSANLDGANFINARLIYISFRNASLREAVFHGTHFVQVSFEGADISRSDWRLKERPFAVCFPKARLHGASLRGCDLNGCRMTDVDLTGADLQWCNLDGAELWRANLDDCDLGHATLRGVNLGESVGIPRSRAESVINAGTYVGSKWTLPRLAEWYAAGAIIESFDGFPPDVLHWFEGKTNGLTLYFSTRLSFFDRFLVEGVIFAVVGRDTPCRVVEFREVSDNNALVRLAGAPQADLERVAEALWNRVWDIEEQSQLRALAVATKGLQMDLRAGLNDLVARLERMELRLPSADVIEMHEDQGAKFVKEKYEKLFETGAQKAARLLRTWGTRKVLGELDGEVTDVVKDGLGLGKREG